MLKLDEKVLKGRFIIAQGKRRRSVALGCGMESEIVREVARIENKSLLRTEQNH